MKQSLLLFSPLIFGFVGIMLWSNRGSKVGPESFRELKVVNAANCAPGPFNELEAMDADKHIVLLPGWGDHHFAVTTASDSAQIYFNQGLSMYYSYHVREAIASFREAARFDSTCAMAYWGQALALGPTYNFGHGYKMNVAVPKAIKRMNEYAASASPKEKDMIAAMNARYQVNDSLDSRRSELNSQYAKALSTLVKKYSVDHDIKALYVDAVMLIHPWSFWNNDGSAKPWTTELVTYCEDVLEADPHHPAALHYYIHLTEASRSPELALASADSLLKLFPGVAHMVHMSSHEYERIGYYEKGVKANEAADNSLVQYDSLAKGYLSVGHVPHYYAVDAYCAMSGNMRSKAVPKSLIVRNSINVTTGDLYSQYLYMFPELAKVRMGLWNDILASDTKPDPQWIYAQVLNHFTRGVAYSRTGKLSVAKKHLRSLTDKLKSPELETSRAPYFSKFSEVALVASHLLSGIILYEQQNYQQAIVELKKAVAAEDSLLYTEPKLWMLPARQYLGAVLLELKRAGEAEAVYREDLVWNPGNGWSLLGLHQALHAQGKTKELKVLKDRYEYSFSAADEIPPHSAY